LEIVCGGKMVETGTILFGIFFGIFEFVYFYMARRYKVCDHFVGFLFQQTIILICTLFVVEMWGVFGKPSLFVFFTWVLLSIVSLEVMYGFYILMVKKK
jgi:hypothetical protein